jgi:hypothetical protein
MVHTFLSRKKRAQDVVTLECIDVHDEVLYCREGRSERRLVVWESILWKWSS